MNHIIRRRIRTLERKTAPTDGLRTQPLPWEPQDTAYPAPRGGPSPWSDMYAPVPQTRKGAEV